MSEQEESHERELRKIRARFATKGVPTQIMPRRHCPFDLLLGDEIKVEVKVAEKPQSTKNTNGQYWQFNIHRHGVEVAAKPDFYIFCIPAFLAFGFKTGVRIIVPENKVGKRLTIRISARSLINKWSNYINNWTPIDQRLNCRRSCRRLARGISN